MAAKLSPECSHEHSDVHAPIRRGHQLSSSTGTWEPVHVRDFTVILRNEVLSAPGECGNVGDECEAPGLLLPGWADGLTATGEAVG